MMKKLTTMCCLTLSPGGISRVLYCPVATGAQCQVTRSASENKNNPVNIAFYPTQVC